MVGARPWLGRWNRGSLAGDGPAPRGRCLGRLRTVVRWSSGPVFRLYWSASDLLASESEHGQAGEVDGGGEQGEVRVNLGPPADPGAAAAVSAAHRMRDLALDLRAGGGVVALPFQARADCRACARAPRPAVVKLGRDHDQRLAVCAAPGLARFHPVQKGLIDLHRPVSSSRPDSTIARRSLCSHAHAV
jgi:hypothetical protein